MLARDPKSRNYVRCSSVPSSGREKKLGKLRSLGEGAKRGKQRGPGKRGEREERERREPRQREEREASSRGQFVHNVNCRNYYDIIIHPNCTANRHAKCLIASSEGEGTGCAGGRRRWVERKVHAIKLIATTLEYNDNPGYTATF